MTPYLYSRRCRFIRQLADASERQRAHLLAIEG